MIFFYYQFTVTQETYRRHEYQSVFALIQNHFNFRFELNESIWIVNVIAVGTFEKLIAFDRRIAWLVGQISWTKAKSSHI